MTLIRAPVMLVGTGSRAGCQPVLVVEEPVEDRPAERRSVFISHAHADNDPCDRYAEALSARGFDVWYDRTDLRAGQRLSAEIARELQHRRAFIVMLSPDSVASYWVRLETDTYLDLMADDPERILIPVRIKPCEVPTLLRAHLWVDAADDDTPFADVIQKIVAALEAPARTGGLAGEMASRRGVTRRTMLVSLAATASLSVVAGSAFTLLAGRSGLVPGLVSTRVEVAPTSTAAPTPTPGVGDAIHTFMGHADRVTAVAWDPDGSRIASGGNDGTIKLWSPLSPQSDVRTYQGHTGSITGLAWSPDGGHVASASSDGTVRIWDATTDTSPHIFTGHAKPVNSVAWSPDAGYILSTADDGTYRVWSPASLQTVQTDSPGGVACRAGAWSPDSKAVIVAAFFGTYNFPSSVAYVFDWASGSPLSALDGSGQGYKAVAWAPDAKLVAAAGYAQTVDLWPSTAGTGLVRPTSSYSGHVGTVNSVGWSTDGKRIASCGSDQTVQVWDSLTAQGAFISRVHAAAVNALSWSPDGAHIASASDDKTVKIIRTK